VLRGFRSPQVRAGSVPVAGSIPAAGIALLPGAEGRFALPARLSSLGALPGEFPAPIALAIREDA
jgi:hypothetical protein